jgi:hypothetical protein
MGRGRARSSRGGVAGRGPASPGLSHGPDVLQGKSKNILKVARSRIDRRRGAGALRAEGSARRCGARPHRKE